MDRRPKRLRRCQLSVPGSSEKMLHKAAGLEVDHVFLDLEDAVAPSAKREARQKVVHALNNFDWKAKTLCVRVNDTTTEYCAEDIIEVVEGSQGRLDLVMLPKPLDPSDLAFCDKLIGQIEIKHRREKRIGLECLIEEVEAMMNVEAIAGSTPRLEAIIFGMGDYSASQGVSIADIGGESGYPGDIWHYQRQKVTVAARAHGIDAVDGPFANFGDPDTFREECRRAMILGMVGKWAIHPSQVPIAQEVFSPTQADVVRARAMMRAYEEALARGEGSVKYEGRMIDVASVRIVRNLVEKAELIGM